MIKYDNYNITDLYYNNYHIIKVIGCGGNVVYEKETPPVGTKLDSTYCNGGTFTVNCNGNPVLTSGDTNHQIIHTEDYNYYRTAIIGDCVTEIGDSAFESETCLSSVTLPNTLKVIGNYAFYETCMTSINIPSGVTTIKAEAFGWSGLHSITIPSSVTSIGTGAFNRCTYLTSITMEATTPPSIGTTVFDDTNNCPIYVPCNSVNAYKAATNWSAYASRIQCVTPPPPTPPKLSAIYSDTTEYTVNCDSSTTLTKEEVTGGTGTTAITSANVGSCVEVIGNSAFNTCDNLSAVTISSAITSIEYRAFYNCRNLLSITIYASTPPTRGDGAFPVFGASYTVYVPAEYLNTYKSAWSNISSRIQAIPT